MNNFNAVTDERKIDQVVSELGRYNIVVAGLEETKRFGRLCTE